MIIHSVKFPVYFYSFAPFGKYYSKACFLQITTHESILKKWLP